MALAIDASTPATVTANPGPTATVGSFTPPASALLLLLLGMDSYTGTPGAPSATDNLGGHLTYTARGWQSHADTPTVLGQAAMFTAVTASSTAMTVSGTNN